MLRFVIEEDLVERHGMLRRVGEERLVGRIPEGRATRLVSTYRGSANTRIESMSISRGAPVRGSGTQMRCASRWLATTLKPYS
jgi:hypothetical protein